MSAREEISRNLAQIRRDAEMLRIRQEAPELVRRAMERGEIRVIKSFPVKSVPVTMRTGTAAEQIVRALRGAQGTWVELDELSNQTGRGWRYIQGRIGHLREIGYRIECNKSRGIRRGDPTKVAYRLLEEEGVEA